MKLEDIEPGCRLLGVEGDVPVKVLASQTRGADAVFVVWKGASGQVEDRVLYREDESRMAVIPDGRWPFDGDGDAFRLAVEALRVRHAQLFDPYFAANASGIDPLPHQITAVYNAMLARQPLRFLLADDPGAGKTVMAGLLIKELIVRGSLERCLIIVPGNLVDQWRDELSEKFGLDFQVLTRAGIDASRSGNPFLEHRRVIARLDMLARNDELKRMLEEASDPEWDLVVVDEAHRMSATFYGHELKTTKRFQLGQLVGRLTRHLLLMTATPHNGKERDFQLFMSLLDRDRFGGRFEKAAGSGDPSDVMRRLVKEELFRMDGKPLFPERRAYTAAYGLSPEEARLYDAMTRYVREEMNRADRLGDDGSRRRQNVGFALQVLQRRLASSPAAIHTSLKRRLCRLTCRLEKAARSGRDPHAQAGRGPDLDDEDLEEAPGREVEAREDELAGSASAAMTIAELEAEIVVLRGLERMAAALRRSGRDSKWRQLKRILRDPLVHDPARGVQRKIVVFTEARDTLYYLAERIGQHTGAPNSVAVIHGGVPRAKRKRVIKSFTKEPQIRFLVATDAAGEGVNLHEGAHLMVNYDLPWNPNRIEQRFGRIHRIGQREVCHLWNLVAHRTREGAVYERLLEKLEAARETLGGRVYDVMGELFEARPLKDLFVDAIRYGERDEVRGKLFREVDGAVDVDHINRIVERGKLAREGIDPAGVEPVRENVERALAMRMGPHHLRSLFEAAFQDSGGTMHATKDGGLALSWVPEDVWKRDRSDSIRPSYERVRFGEGDDDGEPDSTLMAPGHPLFDSLVDPTTAKHREMLLRGAILVDESNRWSGPRVLATLRSRIRDGVQTRDGRPNVVSERVQFVWLHPDGTLTDAGAAPHLNCRSTDEAERPQLREAADAPWLEDPIEERVQDHAVREFARRHLSEVRDARLPGIDRAKAAVEEHLHAEIAYLQKWVFDLEAQEIAGEKPSASIEGVRRQAEELFGRLERRRADFELQRKIDSLTPEICGAALVVPAASLEGPVSSDTGGSRSRVAIQAAAMRAVMDRERELGREPADVSAEGRGYDVESRDPNTGGLRFVAVKCIRAGDREVTVTRTEMLAALNVPESYLLALVPVDRGVPRRPTHLKNPARVFGTRPDFPEASRRISVSALKHAVARQRRRRRASRMGPER